MTDQQKEEEAMFKHTFNFYQIGKGNVQLERYELPMILDGKSPLTSHEVHLSQMHRIECVSQASTDCNF